MDEKTLELLRLLQAGAYDDGTFAKIEALLPEQRARLAADDDRATLSDLSELLELWAENAPGPLGGRATYWAAAIVERDLGQAERAIQLFLLCLERQPSNLEAVAKLDGLLRACGDEARLANVLDAHARRMCAIEGADPVAIAGIYRRLGDLRAGRNQAGAELDATIDAYEQALDLAADTDLILLLAEMYVRRGAEGDAARAAEFFCTLGDVLGEVEGRAMLERALDQLPSHDAALDLLETYVPQAEHAATLEPRWAAYIERSENEAGTDKRRIALAHAYEAQGRHRDALICLAPVCEKGESAALTLQAACLAGLRSDEQRQSGAEAPATPSARGAVPMRPATLVGFRLPPNEPESGVASAGAETTSGEASRTQAQHARKHQTLVGFQLSQPTAQSAEPVEARAGNVPVAEVAKRSVAPSATDGPGAKAAAIRASSRPPAPLTPSAPPRSAPSAVPSVTAIGAAAKAAALRASSTPAPPLVAASSPPRGASTAPAMLASAAAPAPAASSRPAPRAGSAAPIAGPAVPLTPAPTLATPMIMGAVVAPREETGTHREQPATTPFWSGPRVWIVGALGALAAGGAVFVATRSEPAPGATPAYASSRGEAVAPEVPAPAPAPPPAVVAPTPAAAPAVETPPPAPAARSPKLISGKVQVKGGHLTAQQIKLALEDNMAVLERCYETALRREPDLKGQLTFSWTVDKGGRPTRVRKVDGDLKNAPLERCSLNELKKARFPKAKKKPALVTWPVNYRSA